MQSNTENFLMSGFQRLLQDKEMKKNQNQTLKKSCDKMLNELRNSIVENGSVSSVLPAVKSDGDNIMSNSKYFEPFEYALASKSQSIVVIALDCLQKLIAYGHISNKILYKDSKERLIEKIVTYVCDCFQNGLAGDHVQLQIIKAILTIINNNELEIHENHLISMVRTCYSIFLACKDPVIQHTAKGTLTQMLNTIFTRMETKTMEEYSQTSGMVITEETEVPEEEICSNNSVVSENMEIIKTEEVMESSEIVKSILDDVIDNVVSLKIDNSEVVKNNDENLTEQTNFAHIYQKDAFLVFRCLCKLSLKALREGNPDPRSHDLRSKILSLELLLNILQNPGPVFKQSDVFINAIKQYLCVALSKNGVSSVSDVFELSLSIFLSLLSNFKQHLKRQNEVFFKEIFLYILESPRSSYIHKDLVLEALKRICINAQCVVDIYLNYDCDLSLANIFERLVNDLAKIAQGRYQTISTNDIASQNQSRILRTKSLDCLYNILRCMVEWSKEMYASPDTLSHFGSELERHDSSASQPKKRTGSMNSINTRSSSQSSLVTLGTQVPLSTNDNPEQFATKKQQKELFEQGIAIFNKKPLKGVTFLQSNGLLGTSVDDVAEFLHKDERLNKTMIGDFLGENDKFNIEVMYAFVDQFNFMGKEFVSALREFLAGFRMPGEAQKIDRLMEKFAARYCECNVSNTVFKSAEAAYVLAYSIIMLTTDLHSSQIKNRNRMKKEDYIKMNRGINESDDIDVNYLGKIYDEIAGNEIKMKECSVEMKQQSSQIGMMAANEKQRQLLFNMEVEEMAKAAKELMESISHIESSDFTSATHQEHVEPMFKLVWTPLLAAFSVGLQDCDDSEISRFCLEGIRCAIRIACIFKMELERNAYIQALSRFTLLITGVSSNSGGIKPKNIDTIKTLIHVAHSDGNYLGSSWLEILRCISQLESSQLIGGATGSNTGPPHGPSKTIENTLPQLFTKKLKDLEQSRQIHRNNQSDNSSINSSNPSNFSDASGSIVTNNNIVTPVNFALLLSSDNQKNMSILQEVMGETGSQSVIVAVDKVFTGSVKLDGDAIVEFVKALCQVSRDELGLPQPRIFSLQKLVEISYYNMGRIRLQWSRVWNIIGEHFTNAGLSTNQDVAIFAMDSLRQLAVKFIEKGEFPNFHFQKDFLRPFVEIMENKSHLSQNVEDMVVRCVAQLVHSHWSNIRSGWSNVFLVFQKTAAGAPIEKEVIVEMAFDSLAFVVKKVFKTSFQLVIDSFQNLVKSLSEFACNTNFPDINMESIRLLRECAKYVDEQSYLFREITNAANTASMTSSVTLVTRNTSLSLMNGSTDMEIDDAKESVTLDEEDRVWVRGWMPVFCELYGIINSCKLDVRTRGLTVYFEILKSYGGHFRGRWWRDSFNLVFRVFQHTTESGNQENEVQNAHDRSEWLNTTCNHALYAVVDVFSQYYENLCGVLMDDLLARLKWCCLQDYEQLARSGTSCIETLVLSNGVKFDEETWQKIVDLLNQVFQQTAPHQLFSWKPNSMTHRPTTLPDGTADSSALDNKLETFATLLVKCVVQYELIQAVGNIVFYPATSRKEDADLWRVASQMPEFFMDISVTQSHNQLDTSNAALRAGSEPPPNTLAEEDGNMGVTRKKSKSKESRQSLQSESSLFSGGATGVGALPAGSSLLIPAATTEEYDQMLGVGEDLGVVEGAVGLPRDGLYTRLRPTQLMTLVNCLMEAHRFARRFNCDHEQRNLLWKAGFKGKAKPNLIKQETQSFSLAIRILFKLLDDSRIRNNESELKLEEVEKSLCDAAVEAIYYFRTSVCGSSSANSHTNNVRHNTGSNSSYSNQPQQTRLGTVNNNSQHYISTQSLSNNSIQQPSTKSQNIIGSSEQHKLSWASPLVLLLTRLILLAQNSNQSSSSIVNNEDGQGGGGEYDDGDDKDNTDHSRGREWQNERFMRFARILYLPLCDLVTVSGLPNQIRVLYRAFLINFGEISLARR